MPCLVHEVRVARDGIDLAVRFLELRVVVLQVFKLRRANEREVCRIEEEYAPLAEHIRLRHRAEGLILVSLYSKISDFLVD